jgi:MFS transporter, DHA1 family, inner membrane transport protein
VLGAPLGTVMGRAWGWHAAIWFITAVAGIVAVAIGVLLPVIRLEQSATLRERLAPLTDRRVLRILLVTLLAFIGIFLPFTYMSAVFAHATGGDQGRLALLLMIFGIAATAGNLTAGRLADRYDPRLVVIGATLGIAVVFLVLLAVRESFVAVAIMHALSGLVSYSVIGPQAHRIIAHAPKGGAPLVISLNGSVVYLGNFASSVLGAIVIAAAGAVYVLPIAAALALTACLLAWWTGRPSEDREERVVSGIGEAAAAR